MPIEQKKDYTLHSVKKAMRILRLFSLDRPELGVTDIAKLLELNKSTAHDLLSALTAEGFLEKTPKSKYRLSLALLRLTGIITTQMEIHREAMPILTDLAERLGETAYIGMLEGTDVAYLHRVECRHPNPLLSQIGKRNPVFCTGSGKAILAHQKKEIIEEMLVNLKPYGPNSITDPERFMLVLQQIRTQGYALCVDEIYEGVSSIGVPVRDYTGKVVAAISIVGPTDRMQCSDLPFMTRTLMKAGQEISGKLGGYTVSSTRT